MSDPYTFKEVAPVQEVRCAYPDQEPSRCLNRADFNAYRSGRTSAQRKAQIEELLATCSCCALDYRDYCESLKQFPHLNLEVMEMWEDLPEVLGNYRLVFQRPFAMGGFGGVFLAENLTVGDQHKVALKVVPRTEERFATELEGIRLVYGVVSDYDRYFMRVLHLDSNERWLWYAMDLASYVDPNVSIADSSLYQPRTLEYVISTTGLTRKDVLNLGLCLVEAVTILHGRNIAHGDIKPANVFWRGGGWRLGDFGLAHALDAPPRGGTPFYQVKDNPPNPQSDLAMIGKTLFRALEGAGECEDSFEAFAAGPTRDRDDPLRRRLRDVILRLCHPEPGCRYQNATAVKQDLEQARAAVDAAALKTSRKIHVLAASVALALVMLLAVWIFRSGAPVQTTADPPRLDIVGYWHPNDVHIVGFPRYAASIPSGKIQLSANCREEEYVYMLGFDGGGRPPSLHDRAEVDEHQWCWTLSGPKHDTFILLVCPQALTDDQKEGLVAALGSVVRDVDALPGNRIEWSSSGSKMVRVDERGGLSASPGKSSGIREVEETLLSISGLRFHGWTYPVDGQADGRESMP